MTSIKRSVLAAVLAVPALTSIPQFAAAATHPDGNGGAVCKGIGSCLVLELDCKGTYTDATQPDGTVYGKCDKVKSVAPRALNRMKAG
ncbi:MAG: hypothetical protein AB7I79_10990 [Rhizobiaceae bacterium]